MSVPAYRVSRLSLLGSSALVALLTLGSSASAQGQPAQNQPAQGQPVPSQPAPSQPAPSQPAAPPSTAPTPSAAAPATAAPVPPQRAGAGPGRLPQITVTAPPIRHAPRQVVRRAPSPPTVPPVTPAEQLTEKQNGFDTARSNLYTTIGTTSDTLSRDTIEALPQGTNRQSSKCCCRLPACRRTPPPAARSMSATITPMCNSASTASCCLTALPASAVSWTPI